MTASLKKQVDTIDQCEPTGFDNIIRDADGAPTGFAVCGNNEHACFGGGRIVTVEDADLVVDE